MMMRMKTVISIIAAAIVLLSGVSCTPQEQPGGAVTVILSTGLPETRGAAEVADGSEIYLDNNGDPDLILLLFNSQGALVAKYPDPDHASVMNTPTPSGGDMMIRISKTTSGGTIPAGDYTLYGIANTAGLWTMTDGSNTISASSITTKTQADNLYFSQSNPTLQASRLPLTSKTTVTVSANGNGSAELVMRRCVAQVVVRVVNNYGAVLTLGSCRALDPNTGDPINNQFLPFFSLHELNASTGYLFQHSPDQPASVVYSDLVNSTVPASLEDNTAQNSNIYEYSSLVFPGTGSYLCDIAFAVTHVGASELDPAREFRFTDLPVHNNRGEDITSISRNQRLTITVTISQGQMLSFSFDVGDWTEKTETVSFD